MHPHLNFKFAATGLLYCFSSALGFNDSRESVWQTFPIEATTKKIVASLKWRHSTEPEIVCHQPISDWRRRRPSRHHRLEALLQRPKGAQIRAAFTRCCCFCYVADCCAMRSLWARRPPASVESQRSLRKHQPRAHTTQRVSFAFAQPRTWVSIMS